MFTCASASASLARPMWQGTPWAFLPILRSSILRSSILSFSMLFFTILYYTLLLPMAELIAELIAELMAELIAVLIAELIAVPMAVLLADARVMVDILVVIGWANGFRGERKKTMRADSRCRLSLWHDRSKILIP